MFFKSLVLLAACLAAIASGLPNDLPNYVRLGECRTSADCGPSSCCVIGMMRFSLPTCLPMRQLGEACRPASNQPINTILSYPGGLRLSLHDVYQVLCPCAQGLTCSRFDGMCVRDNDAIPYDNSI